MTNLITSKNILSSMLAGFSASKLSIVEYKRSSELADYVNYTNSQLRWETDKQQNLLLLVILQVITSLVITLVALCTTVHAQNLTSQPAGNLASTQSSAFQRIAPLPSVTGQNAGYLKGHYSVTESGAAHYSMPLEVLPGTAGLQPKLSLEYDSRSGNGILGVGWSLSGLSTITRCATNLTHDGFIDGVDFDSNDRLCLDGQRLNVVNGTYLGASSEYRTQNDIFTKILAQPYTHLGAPTHFDAWTKSGLHYIYASTNDARVEAQGRLDILMWRANQIIDSAGNVITIEYHEDHNNGESYVAKMVYASNSQAIIDFVYETRPDIITSYVSGSKQTLSKRLTEIKLNYMGSLIRSYKLSYEVGSNSFDSRLVRVELCSASGECLNPTTIDWSDSTPSTLTPVASLGSANTLGHNAASYSGQDEHFADLNGDGRSDRVWYPASYGGPGMFSALSNFSAQGQQFASAIINNVGPEVEPGIHVQYADVNGDGRADRVWAATNTSHNDVWVSLGNNSGLANGQIWIDGVANPQLHQEVFNSKYNLELYGDINGDGRSDRLYAIEGYGWGNGNNSLGVWGSFSTGSSFTTPQPMLGYIDPQCYPNSYFGEWESMGDFNGDGLADWIVYPRGYCDIAAWYVATSTGGSLSPLQPWLIENPVFGVSLLASSSRRKHFADVNGDGLTDYIWNPQGRRDLWVALSNGAGFNNPTIWVADNEISGSDPLSASGNQEHLIDMNNDGRADLVIMPEGSEDWWVLYSNGLDFVNPVKILANGAVSGYKVYSGAAGWHEGWSDVNGDSLPDFTWLPPNADGRLYTALHAGVAPNLVTRIANGHGRILSFEFKPISDPSVYTKYNDALYPIIDIQGAMYVVSALEDSNGLGAMSRISYHYHGLKASLTGDGFCGFHHIEAFNHQDNTKTTNYYRQDFPFKSLPLRTTVHDSSGTLLNESETRWFVQYHSGSRYSIHVEQSIERQFSLTGVLKHSTTNDFSYDTFGNVISQITTSLDGHTVITVNLYDNDVQSGQWLLGRLRRSEVTHQSANGSSPDITRVSSFAYDSTTGLLIEEVIEPGNTTLELTTTYQRDQFGNIRFSTKSGPGLTSRTVETQYDGEGRFVLRTINPLGHIVERSYNTATGDLLSERDPNGLLTNFVYDNFGRLYKVIHPHGTESRTVRFLADSNSPPGTAYYERIDSSGSVPVIIHYDLLDREIRSETLGFDGQSIFVDTEYNDRGQIIRKSEPYFTGQQIYWTEYSYDVLGRTFSINQPGNRISSTLYDQGALALETTTINPLGQSRTVKTNSRGQNEWIRDHLGSKVYHFFDAVGNLTSLIDNHGNEIKYKYDVVGNRKRVIDPDIGTVNYKYDAFGQLIERSDAAGNITTYEYDKLGRMTVRSEAEGTSSWSYDSTPNGIGQVSSVSGPNGYQQNYRYGKFSRIAKVETLIDGLSFTEGHSYDAYGRPRVYTYPSGMPVMNIYNALGFLESVVDQSVGVTIWRAEQRDARGQFVLQRFGNDLLTKREYQPETGFLRKIETGLNYGSETQNLSFVFDELGNLKSRSDLFRSLSESFSYDGLNRLTNTQVKEQGNIIYSTQVTYDSIGNITYKSDQGNYVYGAFSGPHQLIGITGPNPKNFSYDLSGNRITENSNSYEYTSFNKPSRIVKSNRSYQYSYGPDYRHYKMTKTVTGANPVQLTKYYVGGRYEREIKNGETKHLNYIHAGEELVAIRTNSDDLLENSLTYLHKDHLGSVQSVTDEAGQLQEVLSYDAWGARRVGTFWIAPIGNENSSIHYGFTGHEHMDDIDLIHMGGRVYDPIVGRFLSADPFIQEADNLQSLNRYSYVLNNPLSYTDPSGYFFKKFFGKLMSPFKGLMKNEVTAAILQVVLLLIPPQGAWSAGFNAANSFANGKELGDVSIDLAVDYATQRAIGTVGDHFQAGDLINKLGSEGSIGKAIAHGTVGGIKSLASGGKFEHGFMSAAAVELFAPGIAHAGSEELRVALSAAVGGTASAIAGGSFANGAVSGAYTRLFNHEAHSVKKGSVAARDDSFLDPTSQYDKVFTEHGLKWYIDSLQMGVDSLAKDFNIRSKLGAISDIRAYKYLTKGLGFFSVIGNTKTISKYTNGGWGSIGTSEMLLDLGGLIPFGEVGVYMGFGIRALVRPHYDTILDSAGY